jgi:hypothetical protein
LCGPNYCWEKSLTGKKRPNFGWLLVGWVGKI